MDRAARIAAQRGAHGVHLDARLAPLVAIDGLLRLAGSGSSSTSPNALGVLPSLAVDQPAPHRAPIALHVLPDLEAVAVEIPFAQPERLRPVVGVFAVGLLLARTSR